MSKAWTFFYNTFFGEVHENNAAYNQILSLHFSSVQSLSRVQPFGPHALQHTRLPCPSPSRVACSNSCPSSQWCHPTISSSVSPFFSCLQSFPATGLFQWVSSLYQVAKVLEFQLQHQSFQWTPRTDLFRMDWLDLLAVQGTLKSLLQHHSSKASILWHSPFFMVQFSHPYMTTGKPIALTTDICRQSNASAF